MKGWDEAMKNTDEKTISAVQELEWFREVLLGKQTGKIVAKLGSAENLINTALPETTITKLKGCRLRQSI